MNQNWGLAFMLSNEIISLTTKLSSLSTKISSFFDVSQGYIPYRKSDLVAKYGKEIQSDVLADDIVSGQGGYSKEWDINGETVTLGVER